MRSLTEQQIAHLRATWTDTHGTFMDAVDEALAAQPDVPTPRWLAQCDALSDDYAATGSTAEEAKERLVEAIRADVDRGFLNSTLDDKLGTVSEFDEWFGIRTIDLAAASGQWRNWTEMQ